MYSVPLLRLVRAGNWELLTLAPQTGVLRDRDVAENVALAGEAESRLRTMRRKAEAPELYGGRRGDRAFDANGAGPASTQAATVNRSSNSVVQRKPGAKKNRAKIRAMKAFDRLSREVNDRHSRRSLLGDARSLPRSERYLVRESSR